MEKTRLVNVYRLYKLSKGVGNTFSDDFKKLERDLHVVTNDYAELINRHSTINGLLYEKDEKASELYWKKQPFDGIVAQKVVEAPKAEVPEPAIVEEKEDKEDKVEDVKPPVAKKLGFKK
jgi:hypothetical protein